MTRYSSKYKKVVKEIAKRRIKYLFQKAGEVFVENKDLANRYVELARIYSQRAKVKIPNEWKRRICHKCKKFLYPGLNCRFRIHSKNKKSHISMTCFECNRTTRYIINKQ